MQNLGLNLKRLFFIISIFIIFNMSAFAESGFEFHYSALAGVGVGIPTKSMKDLGFKNDFGLTGIGLLQFGYMSQVKEGLGISYLLELGYNLDYYSIIGKPDFNRLISSALNEMFGINISPGQIGIPNDVIVALNIYFGNIQIGLFPKFNFGNFAIGIGGGVKIPLVGKMSITAFGYRETQELDRVDIVDMFNPPIFGYVRTSFDYSFYLSYKVALDIGLYLGYDIIKFRNDGGNDEYGGTLNAGVSFGVKFGGREEKAVNLKLKSWTKKQTDEINFPARFY